MGNDEEPDIDDLAEKIEALQDQLDDDPDLDAVDPWEAIDLWLDQHNGVDSTIGSYRRRLKWFPEFLDERGVETLDEVTTRDIKEFEADRRSKVDRSTANNQLGTLRQFLRYAVDLNAVHEDVLHALEVPDLSKDDRVNTEKLVPERAEEILEGLETFRYASRDHVVFLLLWRTTIRIGTLYSLDLKDVYLDDEDRDRLRVELRESGYHDDVVDEILNQAHLPFLYPRHRPERGTRLKNGEDGERVINIADWVAGVVRDYIQVNRPDVQDDHGRQPLIASRKGDGRLSKSAIRSTSYLLTQPCEFGAPCPHGREKETCEAREHGHGSKCPSSRSPHKLRTGSITWHRDQGWPLADLSDKANAGEDLIREVYDQPETLVRGANRREHLDKLDTEDSS